MMNALFTVPHYFNQVRETQALILAPTRELAVQIQKVGVCPLTSKPSC